MPPTSVKSHSPRPASSPAPQTPTAPKTGAARVQVKASSAAAPRSAPVSVGDRVSLGHRPDSDMQLADKLRAAAQKKNLSTALTNKPTVTWSGVSTATRALTGYTNIKSGLESCQKGDKLQGGISVATGVAETGSATAEVGMQLAKLKSGVEFVAGSGIGKLSQAFNYSCVGLSGLGAYVNGLEAAKALSKGDTTTAFLKATDSAAGAVGAVTSLPAAAKAIAGVTHLTVGEAAAASGGTAALALAAAAATGWGVGRAIGSTTGLDEVATTAMEKQFFGEAQRELALADVARKSNADYTASVDDRELQRLTKVAPELVGQAIVGTLTEIETARESGNSAELQGAQLKLQRLRSAQRGELA